jgi:hypothetical protein
MSYGLETYLSDGSLGFSSTLLSHVLVVEFITYTPFSASVHSYPQYPGSTFDVLLEGSSTLTLLSLTTVPRVTADIDYSLGYPVVTLATEDWPIGNTDPIPVTIISTSLQVNSDTSGILIYNASSDVAMHADVGQLTFIGKATEQSVAADDFIKQVTYQISTSVRPQIAIAPKTWSTSAMFEVESVGLDLWEIKIVLAVGSAPASDPYPDIYCFYPPSFIDIDTGYGLNVYDSANTPLYSSNEKIANIEEILTIHSSGLNSVEYTIDSYTKPAFFGSPLEAGTMAIHNGVLYFVFKICNFVKISGVTLQWYISFYEFITQGQGTASGYVIKELKPSTNLYFIEASDYD